MNSQRFVDVIREVVRDSAVTGELAVLHNPPGRRPSADLVEQSKWYSSLNEREKSLLASIVSDTARAAVFGFLCVLDGVRAIEDEGEKGRLELWYIKERSELLNPPDGPMLYEMFNADLPDALGT